MPTFLGLIKDSQIILNVIVQDDDGKIELGSYPALVDTGAQSSAISAKVVSELKLEPDGWRGIIGVHGQKEVNEYVVKLGLPITEITGKETLIHQTFTRSYNRLRVTELDFGKPKFDVLLGMDFLIHFHITIYDDHFLISN